MKYVFGAILLITLCGSTWLTKLYRSNRQLNIRLGHNDRVISILFHHIRRLVEVKDHLRQLVDNYRRELDALLDEEDTEEEIPTIDSGYCEF